jgi:hypothetical protein
MTKCPPLFDRDTQARVRVGFAEASETGDIPEIIGNDRGLYEGDLTGYFRALIFHATNLTRPYHNLRHMLHVTWLCYQAAEFYRDRTGIARAHAQYRWADGARSTVRELAMPYRVDKEHVLFGYLFQCFAARREA